MTLEEAQKVAKVAETADGGCPHCVEQMKNELMAAFPEFVWVYKCGNTDGTDEEGIFVSLPPEQPTT